MTAILWAHAGEEHVRFGWVGPHPIEPVTDTGLCAGCGLPVAEVFARAQPCGCIVATIAGVVARPCKVHKIGSLACCEQAKTIPCVCYQSYTCPEHGTHHHGTHD